MIAHQPCVCAGAPSTATLTPRCPQCDYILIGLPGNRCPECGSSFDWAAVMKAAQNPGLPIERSRGWCRLTGALSTWLLVLFRPRKFARRSDTRPSTGIATLFAATCVAFGLAGYRLIDGPSTAILLAWAAGIWFHLECQSALLFVLDFRPKNWLRQWLMWRKISLYTTAFVALEWATGPPMIDDYLRRSNFPWLLDPSTWQWPTQWWPYTQGQMPDLLRGAVYYWWLAVLMVVAGTRLRRKWCLLVVLAGLPVICQLAGKVAVMVYDLVD